MDIDTFIKVLIVLGIVFSIFVVVVIYACCRISSKFSRIEEEMGWEEREK